MADPASDPVTTDPDHVPELLCVGKFNITSSSPFVTLTFTHNRPKAAPLLDAGVIEFETIVRARIVTTMDNLVALRDVLNRLIEQPQTAAVTGGEPTLN